MAESKYDEAKQDQRLNPSSDAARQERVSRELQDKEENYGQMADDSQEDDHTAKAKEKNDPNENRDDVKDKEDEGGGWTNKWSAAANSKGKLDIKSTFKKNGPLGALILLLGGGGIAITGLLSPSLLLVQITDMFTNNFNDAHTAVSVRTNAVLAKKIGHAKNAFAETSDGKCGIRCKTTTMSDTMVRNLEAREFKVVSNSKTTAGFTRHTVQSIEFPDGTIARNGNEFKAALKDPTRAASFARVYNSRTAYFLNSKFGTMLKHKLGINKAYKLAGDSKEKFKQSFRRSIGLPPATTTDPNRPPLSDDEKVKQSPRLTAVANAAGKLGNKPTNVVAAACLAFNTSRAVSASLKLAKYSAYAAFAMTFFNARDKLKATDGGGIDPLVMSELGDMLTYTDPNKTNPDGSPNELYGLSATDSYGYKAAAYGDTGPQPEYSKANSMESSGMLGIVAGMTFFAATNPTTRSVARDACGAAGSPAASFLQCAPTIPTLIGFAACVIGNIGTGLVIGAVIGAALPEIIKFLVSVNLNDIDENTKGALAGDILYPGAGAILGGQAASYGMKTGNKAEITNYVAMGEEIRKHDQAIARIEAKDTPLDVYNQYSFLGSVARNLNIASYANSSFTTTAGKIAATIPQSIASLTSTTKAGTYMPLNDTKPAQYGVADCPALENIGAVGDMYCMPSYTSSPAEMSADIDANLTYMIENNHIDEVTGAPKKDPSDPEIGRQFQLFLDNCVNRIDAMGETSQAIEAGQPGDYEWFIGRNCGLDTVKETDDVKNFRIYAMDEAVSATANGEDSALLPVAAADPNAPGNQTTENSGNVNVNGWTFPTTAGAPLGSPFGPRGGGYHTGIDIGIGSGSPFYATRDGVVETKEYNVYNIMGDGGAWCPVLGLMSDPNQKDIWVRHTVDGQLYTSVYAHMSRYLKKTGDVVKAGDLIGYTGGSGCSSGPHVHFEIWKGEATPSIPGPGMLDPWPLITN